MSWDDSPYIYHYTSYATLEKIIKSKALWASDLRYTNDSQELKHGINIALNAIGKVEVVRFNPEIRKTQEPRFRQLTHMIVSMRDTPPRVFAACFSKRADSLSQWRGYANHDTGICIGFHIERLQQLTRSQPFTLTQCDYAHVSGSQSAWIKGANSFLADINPHVPLVYRNETREIAVRIVSIKDWAFADEKEVRLVHISSLTPGPNDDEPKFVRFDLSGDPLLAIQSVTICPSPRDDLTVESVKAFLDEQGLDLEQIYVRGSQVPYRSGSTLIPDQT